MRFDRAPSEQVDHPHAAELLDILKALADERRAPGGDRRSDGEPVPEAHPPQAMQIDGPKDKRRLQLHDLHAGGAFDAVSRVFGRQPPGRSTICSSP